jgi:hypothetical protein
MKKNNCSFKYILTLVLCISFSFLFEGCSSSLARGGDRDINKWLSNYSKLNKWMAPHEVIALLGKPHETMSSSADQGGNTLSLLYGEDGDWAGHPSLKGDATLSVVFYNDKIWTAEFAKHEDNHRTTTKLVDNPSVFPR